MVAERTIKRLLTRSFVAMVALVVSAGVLELGVVLVQDAAQEELASHVLPLNHANADLRSILNGARGDLRGYSLAGDLSMGVDYDVEVSDYSNVVRLLREPAQARDRAAALIARRTSRRITRPLDDVVDMLVRRRAGDREARVERIEGPSEIRHVATALNATAEEFERIRDRELHEAEASRHRERQLAARLSALETAKTDFMSTVSHELRTPLTSISGYLELIMDTNPGSLTSAQVRMLEVIGRNAVRLRELVEDMLTLANIESGDFRTETEPLDLAQVVERTVSAAGPAADKASVGLHSDVRGPLPLIGDAVQLDRVLSNLLSNAVKFTAAEGTVSVHAKRHGDDLVLTVSDTGMGIPDDEQQALFTRFFRATNAIHKAVPGTGLGLAIVRTIVDQHSGSIEIASTENVGTTATVRLPAGGAAATVRLPAGGAAATVRLPAAER